eukprot:5104671-Lingulodinium_polyedra.AAC.1
MSAQTQAGTSNFKQLHTGARKCMEIRRGTSRSYTHRQESHSTDGGKVTQHMCLRRRLAVCRLRGHPHSDWKCAGAQC